MQVTAMSGLIIKCIGIFLFYWFNVVVLGLFVKSDSSLFHNYKETETIHIDLSRVHIWSKWVHQGFCIDSLSLNTAILCKTPT